MTEILNLKGNRRHTKGSKTSENAKDKRKEVRVLAKTISLSFDGYWREVNKASIPNKSGVYAVYVCKYNAPSKEGEKGQ